MTYHDINSTLSDKNIVLPLENKSNKLLTDKINSYNYVTFPNINYTTTDFIVYSVSTNEGIGLNSYTMVNIFDTFYLDWNNGNIITSDTITHILNTDSDTYTVLNGLVSEPIRNIINSDDFIRTFSV